MKDILLLLSGFLLLSLQLRASYSTDWIRPADNYLKTGTMLARDKADNLIVTGYIQTENIYTRKYDKFGNFLWERISSSGIDNNYEKPLWVNCDKNKNIYVAGYRYNFSSNWDFPTAVVALKYNAAGTLLWKQTIDISYTFGSSSGLRFNLRSEVDNKGNLYIGTAGSTPSGFVFIKLSPAGTVLVNTSVNLGTIHAFSSMRIKGNKVIVTGTASFNQNVAVVTWDTTGTFLWSKIVDGFAGKDVEIDGNGSSFILSTFPNQVSGASGNDFVIYKFNSGGGQIWKKSYDFGGEEVAQRFTLVSGKISVIGFGSVNASYLDWITFQVNTGGSKLWDARYNEMTSNDEQPYFLAAKTNGEVFVTGKGGPAFIDNGSSYLRMVTVKYGNTGIQQWADTVNVNFGWGIACTIASDSSLFVLSTTKMTAFHFLDHTGTGSCGIPTNLSVSNITNTSAKFIWSPVVGAYLYHLRYKTAAAVEWTTVSTNLTSITINTLSAGTTYNYAVEAICNSGPSGFSTMKSFTTTGTGYCSTGGQSTAQEYLTLVWIGAIQNSTGSNNGYADFTNLSTDLIQGSTVNGYLQGNHPFTESEYYSIWIDYNHDNDFTDPDELAVDILSNFFGFISVSFTIPANATLGSTRMRVTQKNGSPPAPCGSYPRGETEDYTVVITPPKLDHTIENNAPKIFPNPFTGKVSIELRNADIPVTLFIYDITGKLQSTLKLTELQNDFDWSYLGSGIYLLKLMTEGKLTDIIKVIKE